MTAYVLRLAGILILALLWAGPLVASFASALAPLRDVAAWQALLAQPQFGPALGLSLWTGIASFLLSAGLALLLVGGIYGARSWKHLPHVCGALLSVPHLAFAIGFGFLIMPAGLLARIAGQMFGWSDPPYWVTTQDPLGLSLIACLVLKETPFAVWAIWSFAQRSDVAGELRSQWQVARSLGHGPRSIWLFLFVPQILPRIAWPLIAMWAYGASVVDMALVIGPTQPPTLAVIAWNDLNHADAAINARGAASALFLTFLLVLCAVAGVFIARGLGVFLRMLARRGPKTRPAIPLCWPAPSLAGLFLLTYGLTLIMLAILSMAGHWAFPALLPEGLRLNAWQRLVASPAPLVTSLLLAVTTTATALAGAILWHESMPRSLDRWLAVLALLAIALPVLVLGSGQYALLLHTGLTGTLAGLFLAHLAQTLAYVVIMLQGPYRAFDSRFRAVSLGLNCSAWRFWWQIKRPLLAPALAASAAVGFAVSMAQYVTAQLAAAGRFSTLPIEAVTLASGGSRSLTAVYALALFIPVAFGFLIAAAAGRPRWSRAWA